MFSLEPLSSDLVTFVQPFTIDNGSDPSKIEHFE